MSTRRNRSRRRLQQSQDEVVVENADPAESAESRESSGVGESSTSESEQSDLDVDTLVQEVESAMTSLSEDKRQEVARRVGLGTTNSARSKESSSRGLENLHKIEKCVDSKRSVIHDYVRDKWPRNLRVLGIPTPNVRQGETWKSLHKREVRWRLGDCLIASLPRRVQQIVLASECGTDVCDVIGTLTDWITEGQSVLLQARQAEDNFAAKAKWESVKSGTVTECLDMTVRKHFQPYIDAMYMYDSSPNTQLLKNTMSKITPLEYKLVTMQTLKLQTDPAVKWTKYLSEVRQLMIGLEYSGQGVRNLGQLWTGPSRASAVTASGKSRSKLTCFACGKEGHVISKCPRKPKAGWKPGCCYKCGKRGHKARDCRGSDQDDDHDEDSGSGRRQFRGNILSLLESSSAEEQEQFVKAINGIVKSRGKSRSSGTSSVMNCSIYGHLSEPSWNEVWDDAEDVSSDAVVIENPENQVLPSGWVCAVESGTDSESDHSCDEPWTTQTRNKCAGILGDDGDSVDCDGGMLRPIATSRHVYDWATNPGDLCEIHENQWSATDAVAFQDLDIYDTGAAYNTIWDRSRFRVLHKVPVGKYPPLNGFNGESPTQIIGEGFVRFVWRSQTGDLVDVDVWCLLYEPTNANMRINLLSAYRLSKLGFSFTLPGTEKSEPVGTLSARDFRVDLVTVGKHFVMPTAIQQSSVTVGPQDSNERLCCALDTWPDVTVQSPVTELDRHVAAVAPAGFSGQIDAIPHTRSVEFGQRLAALGHVDPNSVIKLWKRVGGQPKPADQAWATRHAQIAGKYRASSTKNRVSFPATLAEESLLKCGSVVCGDTLGPFPETKRGNFTLFYYQDFRHRYAWYSPSGACNSSNAWEEFKRFVLATGLPLTFDGEQLSQSCVFWCDGGSEYKSVFRENCKHFGIEQRVFARYYYGRMLGESSHETLIRIMQNNWKSGERNFAKCECQFSDVWDCIAIQSCVQLNLLAHPVQKDLTRHEAMTGIALTTDELKFLTPVPPGSWATVYNPPSARKGKGKLYGKQMLGVFLYTDIHSRVWNVLVPGRGIFRTVDAKFDVSLDHIPPMVCDSDVLMEGSEVLDAVRSAVRHIVPSAEWGSSDSSIRGTDSESESSVVESDDDYSAIGELLDIGIDSDDASSEIAVSLSPPPVRQSDSDVMTTDVDGTLNEDVVVDDLVTDTQSTNEAPSGQPYELNKDVVVIPSSTTSEEHTHMLDAITLSVESIFGNRTPLRVDGLDMEQLVSVTGVWSSILMTADSKWVVAADVPVPRDYVHSQTMEFAEQWKEATDYEFQQMSKENVYTLMTLDRAQVQLKGKSPITTRLVFVVKPDANGFILKFRVRLCVQGFRMTKGVDYFETFAAIPRMSSWRVLMALAVEGKMYKAHLDVSSAFLHSELDECDWYIIRLPEGRREYDERGNELYGLVTKGLYGTPPAPRAWSKKCDSVSEKTGVTLVKSHYDPCVQVGSTKSGKRIYLLRWVDDIIVVADSKEIADEFIVPFCGMLPVTVSTVELYLGAHFSENDTDGTVTVTQTSLIEKGCKSVGLVIGETRPVGAPMDAGAVLRKSACPATERDKEKCKQFSSVYRTGVGILLWIAGMTRPDVAFAASQLSKFVGNPGESHFKCLQRVFKYLLGTKDEGLVFMRDNANNADMSVENVRRNVLVAATDATYGSEEDGSFTFGVVVMLNGTPVSWRSKKWPRPSLSSFQAETIAASEGCRELEYLRGLLGELGYVQEEPTTTYCDNTGTISHTVDAKSTERSKHINVRDFYVRDCQSRGVISITKAHTSNIVADALTKSISVLAMKRVRGALLGRMVKDDARPP
jgi:hypothetical protein